MIHRRAEIWNFSRTIELDISRVRAVEHEKGKCISPSDHTNTMKKPPEFTFQKKNALSLFRALNGASGMLAADWLGQTHVKNYHNFHIIK